MDKTLPQQLHNLLPRLTRWQLLHLYLLALQSHYQNIIIRHKTPLTILAHALLATFIYSRLPHHPLTLPVTLGLTATTATLLQIPYRLFNKHP